MKYCKNCGMLLEDNMERCIGCGTDVTDKDSVSKYPVQVQEQIANEKKAAGKRNLTVVAIIIIFVAILLMALLFAARQYSQGMDTGDGEAVASDEGSNGASEDAQTDRAIKDDEGAYYKYAVIKDDTGHEIFRTVYPEDLSTLNHSVDYSWDSQVFPAVFSFVATNDENTAQLTYRSPQHYQYIKGTAEEDVDIQANVMKCITFYDFKSVEDYVKEMVQQAYPGARKIEETGSQDAGAPAAAAFDKVIKDYEAAAERELPTLFGLSESTKFTHKDTYKSAKIMDYRILTKEDHAVSCRFYVPVFCEKYDFEDEEQTFSGTLSDCYILAFVSFEAGSDELYDWYEDTFDIFVNNSFLMDDFFKGTGGYAADIRKSVSLNEMPEKPGDSGLKDVFYNISGNSIPSYNSIKAFLTSAPTAAESFKTDEYTINATDLKQVFINPDKQLVYATKAADEYPGEGYIEMTLH